MHLSDTRSIAQHKKKYSHHTTEFQKIFFIENTTILEQQNNKDVQILEAH